MKILNKMMRFIALLLIVLLQFVFLPVPKVYAATSPGLAQATSFSILSSTYTNTAGGTTINGDLGYTTGPQVSPTVNGITFIGPSSKYTTAGTNQGSALADLNSQDCQPLGAIVALNAVNLGLGDSAGTFVPGCYSSTGAMNITLSTTVTLKGAGTYIFRPGGALTTGADSKIVLTGGASACDVFWAPIAATSLGANSTFIGTDIDAAGITIGSTVTWTGRALAYGGTVSTDTDTITSTTCAASSTPTPTPTRSFGPVSSSASAPYRPCPPIIDGVVAPLILESRRIDANSVFISWGPYSGTNEFNVRYGFANGNWLYNTDVTGFSTTIGSLPSNQPIWVQVAARNECQLGIYGGSKLVGGPGLPNTGLSSRRNNSPWILAGVFVGISTLLVLIQRKHGCLSSMQ